MMMTERSKQVGNWIPLMDYAQKKGISLSTLRRHIKGNKIQYRIENGRYLLLDDSPSAPRPALNINSSEHASASPAMIARLQSDLQRAQEEIAELKTLIAFYEESMSLQRL